MTKAVLVVLTNPTSPEQEAEYNDWYDNVHLPDCVAVPTFVAATRYRAAPFQTEPTKDGDYEIVNHSDNVVHQYLALYEVETDDLKGSLEELMKAGGNMVISDALDTPGAAAYLYEEITPRLAAGG